MFDKRFLFLGLVLFCTSLYGQGPRANLKFDVDTADFGDVADGDSVIYVFWFTNIGDADLIIKQAYPACGCTFPTFSQGPIKPGERGFVRVVFHSKGFGGEQMVKEVIIINNGDERYARFKVNVVNMEFKKELENYKKGQQEATPATNTKTRGRKKKKK